MNEKKTNVFCNQIEKILIQGKEKKLVDRIWVKTIESEKKISKENYLFFFLYVCMWHERRCFRNDLQKYIEPEREKRIFGLSGFIKKITYSQQKYYSYYS